MTDPDHKFAIEVKRLSADRHWRLCPDAMDPIDCFDHYVALWLRSSGKRDGDDEDKDLSAVQSRCPPGANRIKCARKYFLDSVIGEEGHDIKATRNMLKALVTGDLLKLCPLGPDQQKCLQQYSSGGVQKRSIRDTPRIEFLQRSVENTRMLRRLCPNGYDRIECFEKYMVLWLQVVSDTSVKRFGPGKRSVSPGWDMCPPGQHNIKCYDNYLGLLLRKLMANGSLKTDASARDVENRNAKWQPIKRSGLCPEDMDQVSCFEHYLTMYAKMHGGQDKSNNFVGRMIKRSKGGLCTEDMNDQECLRTALTLIERIENKS